MSREIIDWSLQRKGLADQARHQEKIREAIKNNLEELVSQEDIITADGRKIIRVPIRSLKEYRFRFDYRQQPQVGQGDGNSSVGEVLAREAETAGRGRGQRKGQDGSGRQGQGHQAGHLPGTDYYEAEITVDELAELVFADLQLPDLKPKQKQALPAQRLRFKTVRKKGSLANLNKRRTILANIQRNARRGDPTFGELRDEDLRFRSWTLEEEWTNSAVIIAMRDISASMGEFKKYITRSFYFWMFRFLRTRYEAVEIVFIAHHTEAKEVDEEAFFRLGESGGTRVSSAYELAARIIEERYDPEHWNIYPFHFSDGDNWGAADNRKCVALVEALLEVCNVFGYGEITEGGYTSPLMSAFAAIRNPRFIPVTITRKQDVYPALRKFFRPLGEVD